MCRYGHISRSLIIALIISTFLPASLLYTPANAAVVNSQMVTEEGTVLSERDVDEIKIKRALENRLVQEKLRDSGLSKEQVIEKMDRMSDDEIHQIASLSDQVPHGGHHGVGIVAGVLVVVVLVLLILYLLPRVNL